MSEATVLITGANRGIGRGLTAQMLARPRTTIIAAVRNPADLNSQSLEKLEKGEDSRLILVKIDAASEIDAPEARERLSRDFKISHIDTVIANAGISQYYGPAASTPIKEVRDHFEINAVGPLVLFQAFLPLLLKSSDPKFVAVSTGVASITDMGDMPIPASAYGASKAALNYLVRKFHFENESLTAFSISPGWVQTEMGNFGAQSVGMKEAPVTLEQSVRGIIDKIDQASRERTGGTFQSFDETNYAW